ALQRVVRDVETHRGRRGRRVGPLLGLQYLVRSRVGIAWAVTPLGTGLPACPRPRAGTRQGLVRGRRGRERQAGRAAHLLIEEAPVALHSRSVDTAELLCIVIGPAKGLDDFCLEVLRPKALSLSIIVPRKAVLSACAQMQEVVVEGDDLDRCRWHVAF